jgi:branched-chain amino acid transport system ATP-binding protein
MADALAIRNLNRRFGALTVASDISFSLPVGARTALIGPNGAGKTTLINLVTGALKPSAGRIEYFGRDITAASQAERARSGLLRTFQVTRIFKPLTVADNVRLAVVQRRGVAMNMLLDLRRSSDFNQEVLEILAMLGLEDFAKRPVDSLAYGERRLVELALALAGRPKVLLLDEPAAGVPKGESSIIMRAIERLPSVLAILFIEHDMDLVFRFAQDIIVMVAGSILVTGTPQEIADNQQVREIYFGSRRHAVG